MFYLFICLALILFNCIYATLHSQLPRGDKYSYLNLKTIALHFKTELKLCIYNYLVSSSHLFCFLSAVKRLL